MHDDGLHTSVVCKFPLFDAEGQVYAICGIVTDMTERKRAEAALQQAHDELEDRVRQRTEELSSTNAVLQTEIAERERIAAKLRANEEELRCLSKDLEEQLIESDRLVSVGELAASIAHEFNNPLQIILGYTQDLLRETYPPDRQHESLQIIESETRRCALLIRNLMDFVRPTREDRRLADVEPIVRNSLAVAQGYLGNSKIRIVVDISPNLPPIYAESNQLQQVLLNLIFNAAEAMPNGGTLTVRAATNPVAPTGARKGGREGRLELTLIVTDTGVGIEPAALPKIFRSFFTTKQKKGMGLGLSICERIVKAHGGKISVESTLGKGTTFYLHFPLADKGDDGSDS